jgi:hypothetical protein
MKMKSENGSGVRRMQSGRVKERNWILKSEGERERIGNFDENEIELGLR